MAITKVAAEVALRKIWIGKLCSLVAGYDRSSKLVLGAGEYVLLHYSLVEARPHGVPDAGIAIRAAAQALGGTTIDGSVWIVSAAGDDDSINWSATVWNAVQAASVGRMTEGDLVYVHYSGRKLDQIGVIAEIVVEEQTALTPVQVISGKSG